ncbi:hypothetical protein ACQP2U_03810 [Nocardia sp. CA-084685]|uniref:hypothetical protein n=1 Tax=Nocardia sp. CA-084685 TaxID=3239970 RepID=UPI003D967E1E
MTDSFRAFDDSALLDFGKLGIIASAESREHLLDTADQFRAAAYDVIGRTVDLDSERELQVVLFDELGLPPTPGRATDTATLYALRDKKSHLFLTHLLAYRSIRAAATR